MTAACIKDVCATGDVGVAKVIECTVSDINDLAAGNPLTMGQVTSAPAVATTAAPSSAGSCYSAGDPHFKTFGGQTYDFYGVGLYSLLDTEQVAIQPLHVRAGRASANTGVAFLDKASGDVVKFTATSSGNVVISGSCFSAGTGCSVTTPTPFIAVWTHSSGITVTVRTFPGWIPMNIYVDIKTGALEGPKGEAATGLCISSSATQQVPKADSVYAGIDYATSNPNPSSYTSDDGCGHTAGLLAKAQVACANAGSMTAACIKDVCATGEVHAATIIVIAVSDMKDLAAGNNPTMGQATTTPSAPFTCTGPESAQFHSRANHMVRTVNVLIGGNTHGEYIAAYGEHREDGLSNDLCRSICVASTTCVAYSYKAYDPRMEKYHPAKCQTYAGLSTDENTAYGPFEPRTLFPAISPIYWGGFDSPSLFFHTKIVKFDACCEN